MRWRAFEADGIPSFLASRVPPPSRPTEKGGKKKLTEFNKFMQTEIARLKEENPDLPHKERCVVSMFSCCMVV